MKPIKLYFLIIILGGLAKSCTSDLSILDKTVTFPKEVSAPEGIHFDYLMYENDYNAVPRDAEAKYYEDEYKASETSGMCYKLTNKKAFGPGVNAIINELAEGTTWYQISWDCYKPSKEMLKPAHSKGFVVVSYHRGDSTIKYTTFPIVDLLKQQNKQLVDKWENLMIWTQVPTEVQAGDLLKIYPWNPEGGNLYIDNFRVTVWTNSTAKPEGMERNHIVMEQNYETSDVAHQTTKKTAARGIMSCVLSGQEGYSQFGKGYVGTLAAAKLKAGDYINVSFYALKKHKVRRYDQAANMVISLNRNGQQILWEGLKVEPRLCEGGKQVSDKWIQLEMWQQVPLDAKPTDELKIYPWNAHQEPIYIDDLRIEAWKKEIEN